jgi:transcriptional regulator with XRE-family HTH domain
MTIGERIKRLREALGISQRELARRAGVHMETIQKLEAGTQRDVTIRIALRLCKGLGVSIEALTRDIESGFEPAVA